MKFALRAPVRLLALSLLVLRLPAPATAQIASFRHVVLVIQENRTPDNLFQGLCGTGRTLCPVPYDLQNFGTDSLGNQIPLAQIALGNTFDPGHGHSAFVKMCHLDPATNKCRMDGLPSAPCSLGKCSFEYVNPADVAPYLAIARQYGWANFMFQTNQGPSGPAHQFLFAGTSAPSAADDAAATFVAENPRSTDAGGCLARLDSLYSLISPATAPKESSLTNSPLGTFCFSHPTLASLLDNHRPPLSWKYYNPSATSIWTAPNWIQPICQPDATYTLCTGAEWNDNLDMKPAHVLSDITACHLPSMVWVIPTGQDSDHPSSVSNTGGPSWVASIVNQIGGSTCTDTVNGRSYSYWQDTAIIVTWDDWGGWYDHEAPTLLSKPKQGQGDYQYGFRVPMLFVSAYTPAAYVNSTRLDFGSILRFVEHNFNLGEGALGFADLRATNNLSAFFNLNNAPRPFQPVPTPWDHSFSWMTPVP